MVVDRGDGRRRVESGGSGEIYSVANMITIVRLLMAPVFFTLLISPSGRYDAAAFVLFVVAAITDFLDGQIARRTGTVTALGKAIDPLVDRLLIAFGVLGLYLRDRLPLWVLVVLVLRDVYLLWGAWRLERRGKRMPVMFLGKVTTAVLLTAFSLLILGDTFDVAGITPAEVATVLLYAGVALSLTTAVLYSIAARRLVREDGTGER